MTPIIDRSEFARATDYAQQQGFSLKSFFQHCIRYGDPDGIDRIFEDADNIANIKKALGENTDFARLSLLYLWAQMELAVVWGGVKEEDAAALHFEYAQQAMATNAIEQLIELNSQILHDYATAVKTVKRSLGKYAPVHSSKQFIEENLYEDVDASQVAEHFNFNVDYLSRLFKEDEGVPLATYIRNRKLEESIALLANTSMDIAEISSRLNFSSQSHFSSLFKKTYGMTPKEYRERAARR